MNLINLEEKIMNAWNTANDIELLSNHMMNKKPTEDEIINTLIGLEQIHSMRMEELWTEFENICHQKQSMNNPKASDIRFLSVIGEAFKLLKAVDGNVNYDLWKEQRANLINNFYASESEYT